MLAAFGCGGTNGGVGVDDAPDGGAGPTGVVAPTASPPLATVLDGGGLSAAPILKPGIDPAIFLPTLVLGYHPTPAELATSGKACASDADCATGGGQVLFHCSVPYYGQAQCQGVFPPGDQVVPGVTPSCAYYDCPTGYQCESELETHSVTCLAGSGNSGSGKSDSGTTGTGEQGGGTRGGGSQGGGGGQSGRVGGA